MRFDNDELGWWWRDIEMRFADDAIGWWLGGIVELRYDKRIRWIWLIMCKNPLDYWILAYIFAFNIRLYLYLYRIQSNIYNLYIALKDVLDCEIFLKIRFKVQWNREGLSSSWFSGYMVLWVIIALRVLMVPWVLIVLRVLIVLWVLIVLRVIVFFQVLIVFCVYGSLSSYSSPGSHISLSSYSSPGNRFFSGFS